MAQRRPRSSSPHLIASSSVDKSAKRSPPTEISKKHFFGMANVCSEILCPICYETLKDAHITQCGHTFCYDCLVKSIERYKKCPKCCNIITKEQIYKNLLLNDLILKYNSKISMNTLKKDTFLSADIKKYFLTESKNLNLADTNQMIDILLQHKQKIETEDTNSHNVLLFQFLKKLLKKKEDGLLKISNEIVLIKKDLEFVKTAIVNCMPQNEKEIFLKSPDSIDSFFTSLDEPNVTEAYNRFENNNLKLNPHFENFVLSYFEIRLINTTHNYDNQNSDVNNTLKVSKEQHLELNSFREILAKCCRYSSFECKATLNSASDDYITSNIISSIVFNKENTHFAIGGVTKKIKIYDLNLVENNTTSSHYPLVQMVLSNKISCLSWNALHRNILASSDYEGIVNIWDVDTATRTRCFNEHEKRCWSVDFNEIDPNLIVSGSDDNKVKLWSIKENHSIATLEAKANVCCVKFNPKSSAHLAFGSADHYIHYYDLRNMKSELCTLKGHKKAVSYVKFLSSNELISASTDSQLKYWDLNSTETCLRSFKGHINEKNFVGLAADRNYIVCGSEDNSVYIYYKGITKHLFNYKINIPERAIDIERLNDINEFVSAVCWKKDSEIILAANSRGLIKVLQLI